MSAHPRYQYKPEDLFLTVFVYIDDWLKPYQKLLPRTDKIGFEGRVLRTGATGQQPAQKARRATANFKDGQDRLRRTGSSDWSFGWTIAVVGEILAQPKDGFAGYESTWYWIVNQLFREL